MTQAVFEKQETYRSWDEDYYHPIAERFYDRAVPHMLDLLQVGSEDTVLDAGCGPGVHSIRAAKLGHQVQAIDLSSIAIAEAKRRATAAGVVDKISFEQADLTHLRFADNSFKRIFSWGVIIHIPDLASALDELARILAPGGRLALYVTNDSAVDHTLESIARFLIHKPHPGLEHLPLGTGNWYTMHGEKLWVWRINANAVTEHLKKHGLRLVRREAGELTEIQRRAKGFSRKMLLHANNLWFNMGMPASPAAANLLVYEKC